MVRTMVRPRGWRTVARLQSAGLSLNADFEFINGVVREDIPSLGLAAAAAVRAAWHIDANRDPPGFQARTATTAACGGAAT